ncbi:CHAD domain-containing protein [Pelagibacterium montanilacus]|uniref:CHAD domain-containing protein n=1 Tax=Pelagibacterium montanilacus TaxID=2185280 RepID=UPI000F8DDE6D|nr:CHAD domain-containing protein [Pelagibacterium montanilacus]
MDEKLAYRLAPGEAPGTRLLAVARNLCARLIEALGETGASPEERAYEARKKLKRLRALLALVREIDPELFDQENRRCRDAGRTLAPYRDAQTLTRTLDDVSSSFAEGLAPDALAGLRKLLVAGRDKGREETLAGLGAALDGVLANAHITAGALADADWSDLDAAELATSMSRGYKRARKARARLDRHGDTETAHELRKAIKRHWLAVRLLRPFWPDDGKRHERAVREAVDALGAMQDHDVLARALAGQDPASAPNRGLALALVEYRLRSARGLGHMAARLCLEAKPGQIRRAAEASLEKNAARGEQEAG